MKKLFPPLLIVLFLMVAVVQKSNAQSTAIGDSNALSTADSDSGGQAEAFQATANTSCSLASLSLYVASSNSAKTIYLGLYSASGGHAQSLLGSGSISSPAGGAWDTVALSSQPSITSGATYFLTVLGVRGTIQYRDTNNGGHSETSSQTNLSSLPSTWSYGQSWPSTPVSMYGSCVGSSAPSGSGVGISISPTSATVKPGGTQQFTATVTGSSNTGVSWSVLRGGGSINSSGLYTAPNTTGSSTVQVQSQADTTKTATATVTITSTVSVSVSPGTAAVSEGGTQQFTARVSGSSNTNVTWSGTGIGSISSSGLYTAPNSQGSATVTATSVADTTKYASASVTVPAVSISISPISATVQPSGTQQFTASVSGTTNTGVMWSESGNGSVNGSGLYTAPSTIENDTVTATAAANQAKSASASVTVQQQSSTQCGNTLNWTSSTCQQIGQGQLNTAMDKSSGTLANDPTAWTVISRHGEYDQNETECNIPSEISAQNGHLTITTSAVSAVCGDFYTDGTTRTSPSSWPYTTGDLQWNTFNFTYGTVVYSAKVPPSASNLWPGLLWMLTAACQNTNKYSGDTGFSGCPNVGQAGYTEIDPFECYNGNDGWCQFHVANPGFGIGHGCDASVPISDTGFHTIMLIWGPGKIQQYTDGVLKSTCNQSLSKPMFLIIQTQTGGAGGTPNKSYLPATAALQYVKVCSTTDGSCATVHDNDPSIEFVDRFGGPAQ
ncbi:MAG TPA: Ig-like domain-containing protein [Candidatus Sulfotelmatobacter sp.]|nr:Ig-like domain-containing protein [Candidatus Sulfotelmatobacter sp.]